MLTPKFLALLALPMLATAQTPRERQSFNEGWLFQRDDPSEVKGSLDYSKIKAWILPTGNEFAKDPAARVTAPKENPGAGVTFTQPAFDDSGWRRLNLPHDWAIEGPFKQEYAGETGKLPYWGVGWYRKHFAVPAGDQGRQVSLEIDGAMSYATVWLNGRLIGGWPYGYSSWQLDLTPFLKAGAENVLAIRLDNPNESSRWYPGAGLYRNVWLTKTNPVHVAHWGVFVTTPEVTRASATVRVSVQVDQPAGSAAADLVTALYEIPGADGKPGPAVSSSKPFRAKDGVGTTELRVAGPKLWSTSTPNLYLAVTTLKIGGKVIDETRATFGMRTIKFDPDQGFLLNGAPLKLNGVCQHADLGALGIAINTRALQRQLEILKEMGCNAIRTSHNMPAPELLDLCDRLGMLVMDESFDCWRKAKKRGDYHNLFDDWHEKDMRAEVRRDRNHPSVILYSIGNEIPEQGTPDGTRIGSEFTAIVHEEDPTRPSTIACSSGAAGYGDFVTAVDVFGYNYNPGEYAKWHQAHPTQALFGSETSSTVSSRGEYFFPLENSQADFQVSSYDLWKPRWATLPDVEFKGQDENGFVAGEFVWTGFDYLGEPTPYNNDKTNLLNFSNPEQKAKMEEELKALGKLKVPSRSSYFGIVDLCGFKKDRFYLYQAKWRPDLAMAHLLPHWNWPERVGEPTPVFVYTSGDEAELFLNGKSLGKKKKKEFEYRLRWDDVKYAPGELKVIAFKAGRPWATDIVKTTGAPAKLLAQADRSDLGADGSDLAFVTLTIADQAGLLVPRTSNLVTFEVSGPGEIVATDNGDAASLEPLQAKQRKAFNGMALAIIRTRKGEAGAITLKASADGLTPATMVIHSR